MMGRAGARDRYYIARGQRRSKRLSPAKRAGAGAADVAAAVDEPRRRIQVGACGGAEIVVLNHIPAHGVARKVSEGEVERFISAAGDAITQHVPDHAVVLKETRRRGHGALLRARPVAHVHEIRTLRGAIAADDVASAGLSSADQRVGRYDNEDSRVEVRDDGCAGCIGALLVLDRVSPSQKIVAVAAQCGDRLLARAQRVQNGIGWFSNVKTAKPITGFAHGAAGIAWALLELSARTGNQKYRETALEALAYEHAEYSSAAGNWAENAPGSGDTGPSMAWCYGAPGIGMSRSRALQHLADSGVSENLRHMVREDLERAIAATLERGPGSNHSLCHGDLGNLDFLLQAAEVSGDQQLTRKVNELTNQILASIEEYGWLSGVPLRVESPALMNGLAGVCYGLLRLAGPDRVPSVLTLAPPLSWSCV